MLWFWFWLDFWTLWLGSTLPARCPDPPPHPRGGKVIHLEDWRHRHGRAA